MPLVFIILFALTASFITFKTETLKASKQMYRRTGILNPSGAIGQQLTEESKYSTMSAAESANEMSANSIDLSGVDQTLLRTCRTVHTLALKNNCANKNMESTIWTFLGTPGVSNGTLSSALTGASSIVPAFSCGTISAFGKALILSSLPRDIIDGTIVIYRYDLRGMRNSTTTDPCGYSDVASL